MHAQIRIITSTVRNIESTKKWAIPRKNSPQKQFRPASPISTQNQYSPVSQLGEHSTDFDIWNISPTFRLSKTCSINSRETIVATSPHKQIKELGSSVVSFLKSRMLRKGDISVLEHGLNFCPSLKHYNKESLTDNFYLFIRRLKLREKTLTSWDKWTTLQIEGDRGPLFYG